MDVVRGSVDGRVAEGDIVSDHELSFTARAIRRRTLLDRRAARAALRRVGPTYACGVLAVQAAHSRHLASERKADGRPADQLEQRAARCDRAGILIATGEIA